jgi:hypothetical protein
MNTLKPCSYCGNTSFAYVPNIAVEAGHATTILGMPARTGGHDWWLLNMVSCTQCGNTLIFTTNVQQMSQRIPGSTIVQAAVL